jgi:hypothetical protein
MRLWTIHPSYLDSKGLVAAWREGLLAQKVLEGKTTGYANHPQLLRFKESGDPLKSISRYLDALRAEADARGYRFDGSKIRSLDPGFRRSIEVNEGQILYEFELLLWKLEGRDPARRADIAAERAVRLNGAFERRPGGVEAWEKVLDEIARRASGGGASWRR